MKIIITKTFEKIYNDFFGKEYGKCSIEKIVENIKKSKTRFYLKRPFQKIKINFCNKTIRLLVLNSKESLLIIPIFITDKNDKKYGYNMSWNIIKNKIDILMVKINFDLYEGEFQEYN